MIEKLESRRLFAVHNPTATFSGGVLTIKGGSQSDEIVIVENVETPGANPSNVHVELSTPVRGFYFTHDYTVAGGQGVTAIKVNSGGKNDNIYHTGDRINPQILGSSGIDSITVYDVGTGSSYIDAGSGNDSITVNVATVNPPGTTATTVLGGDGKDTIYINTADPADYDVVNSHAIINGGKNDDTILIYNGVNTITDTSGNDKYFFYGGTNTVTDTGGTNIFTIGDPFHSTPGGTNDITGGSSTDTFYAYNGMNTLKGGNGNDIFHTYAGSTNDINGGGGTDSLYRHNSDGAADTWTSIEKLFTVVD